MEEIDDIIKKLEVAGAFTNPPSKEAIDFLVGKKLPKDYLYFMSKTNGIEFACGCVFAMPKEEDDLLQDELDAFEQGYQAKDWFFFGDDGMGGYVAFNIKDDNNQSVYYFDHEFPEELIPTDTFTDWLKEQLEWQENSNNL
jgi:hypothetical protein